MYSNVYVRKVPLVAGVVASILFLTFVTQPAAASNTWYSVTVDTNGNALGANVNNDYLDGEEINEGSTLIGKFFDTITIKLRCHDVDGGVCDQLLGSALLGVWSNATAPTNSNYRTLIATIDPTTLDPLGADRSYAFVGHTVAAGDVIGLYYQGECSSGSSSECWVSLRYAESEQFGSSSAHYVNFGTSGAGAWNEQLGWDVRMTLTDSEGGVGTMVCPDDAVCLDYDEDGIIDEVLDIPVNGIVNYDPLTHGIDTNRLVDTSKAFVQRVLGTDETTAGIIVAGFVVLVGEALLFAAVGRDGFTGLPVFVHALIAFIGVGAATSMGLINIVYLYFLGVAAAAALAFSVFGGKGGGGD